MTRKIFTYAFILGALVLVLCSMIFFGLQYRQEIEDTYEALQGEASYAASGLKTGGIGYLKSLDTTNRITWIAPDGGVLYDSEYPELSANQGQYSEVQKAFQEGAGRGIRRSSSGGTDTMYYAFLCEDGTVLRLSRPLSAVRHAIRAVSPMLWVVVLVLIISAAMAFRIANLIARPFNELNLDDLSQAGVYPELQPMVERLREQKETIEREASERERIRREAVEQQAREKEQQAREKARQAQEQERMRREFSANVSHELKTPLTSISGFAELMRSGLCDEEKMIEFAGDIYRESQRLIALVNDIIRLSELDEGAMQSTLEEVDLVSAAQDVIRILEPAAKKRRVTLSLEADADSACILGSRHLIEEMIYNLCDNAVKYNRDGGSVLVRICGRPEDKTEEEGAHGGRILVRVEDTGIGIPAEEQERVFERFYRVDKSHSRKIGGTGLGLSIVKHAAQFHGASIELESVPGQGTRISLGFSTGQQPESDEAKRT